MALTADRPVATRVRVPGSPSGTLAALTVVVFLVALRLPIATAVLGLAVLGILHNVVELRYVAGRFSSVFAGRYLALLVALVTGVVICRVLPAGTGTRSAEILLGYVLIGVAWWWAGSGVRPALWLGGWAALGGAALVSLSFPTYHFVVLTHLHNVVPLVFLWDWSRTYADRFAFRAVSVAWVLVLPVLLLAGVFDRWLHVAPTSLGGFGMFTPARFAAEYTPPALDTQWAARFLTVFAFMAMMHYLVWVLVLPAHGPTVPSGSKTPWLLLAGLGGVLLLVLFLRDWTGGKTVYSAVASYHAYLEFPVLLALLFGLTQKEKA